MGIITQFATAVSMSMICLGTFAAGADGDRPSSAAQGRPTATVPLEHGFRDTVRPFLDTYCLGCHGKEKPKGDLDLSVYTTFEAVAKDLPQWETVLEQLKSRTMPPAKAKNRPDDESRAAYCWLDPRRSQTRSKAKCRRPRPGLGSATE